MIRRIKTHNILNGILFSISEFAVTALVLAPFAAYYLTHRIFLYATIAVGIIFNCLAIVAFGLFQLRSKEKDIGLPRVFEKSYRERVVRENPHLFRDTMLLVASILLPFVLLIGTLFEFIFDRANKGE